MCFPHLCMFPMCMPGAHRARRTHFSFSFSDFSLLDFFNGPLVTHVVYFCGFSCYWILLLSSVSHSGFSNVVYLLILHPSIWLVVPFPWHTILAVRRHTQQQLGWYQVFVTADHRAWGRCSVVLQSAAFQIVPVLDQLCVAAFTRRSAMLPQIVQGIRFKMLIIIMA